MIALPPWVDRGAWDGFALARKAARKPLTTRAERLILGKLYVMHAAGQDVNAVLDQSTENGWAGVFPLAHEKRPALSFRERDAAAAAAEVTAWAGAAYAAKAAPSEPDTIEMDQIYGRLDND